jgi:CDP-diglyceride synthetase
MYLTHIVYVEKMSIILLCCSSNAIYHLASEEHLKGVKDFLRKHGGGMDQVDSFRISEDELAKVQCYLLCS